MGTEYWDLFDKDRKPLGLTHKRGAKLPPNTFHIVIEVFTINSKGQILLTQRHKDKTYPLKWECTGGSILAGENSIQGAVRELREETGIVVKSSDLVLIATEKPRTEAFHDIFLVKSDQTAITLQEGETVDAKWVSVAEIHDMINSDDLAEPIARLFLDCEESIKKFLDIIFNKNPY